MTYLSIWKVSLLALMLLFMSSSVLAQNEIKFGSKVQLNDVDEGKALSPLYVGPEFAFFDGNTKGIFDPGDPVYINMDPGDSAVSENDIRLTRFDNYPAGSQVRISDPDVGYRLTRFGTPGFPNGEIRYFDLDGDKAYSFNDPVYLDLAPGTVSAGDVRLTSYLGYEAGSRVRDSEDDNGRPTLTLPGTLSFFNSNGNINNGGWAIYDVGDTVYVDTQYPFNQITINDIRLSVGLPFPAPGASPGVSPGIAPLI